MPLTNSEINVLVTSILRIIACIFREKKDISPQLGSTFNHLKMGILMCREACFKEYDEVESDPEGTFSTITNGLLEIWSFTKFHIDFCDPQCI